MKYITLFIFLIPLALGAQDTIYSVTGKSILVYLDDKQPEDEVRFDMVDGKKKPCEWIKKRS